MIPPNGMKDSLKRVSAMRKTCFHQQEYLKETRRNP